MASWLASRAPSGVDAAGASFRRQKRMDSLTGLVALGGLIFGFCWPGWAIVPRVLNSIEKNRDAGIDDLAKELM